LRKKKTYWTFPDRQATNQQANSAKRTGLAAGGERALPGLPEEPLRFDGEAAAGKERPENLLADE
jgi:hypothetical protein